MPTFSHPSSYPESYIIKPTNQINVSLIEEEEWNIKRIVASIMSKTGTVSTIIKKFSSSLRSNKTRKAIAEYNKILRTLHILRTINNLGYRQNIQVALSRGEGYHQLNGAIGYANGGKIIVDTEQDQLIYKECTRLIANAIIYYNSYILTQFLMQKEKLNQPKQLEALKRISPIAWQHINIHGRYIINKRQSGYHLQNLARLIKDEILIDDILEDQIEQVFGNAPD